jgi:hypothetical protein
VAGKVRYGYQTKFYMAIDKTAVLITDALIRRTVK